jgi:hypothetical protein
MALTACLVSLVSTVSGRCKNAHGKGSTSIQHITNLSNLLFYRYLWWHVLVDREVSGFKKWLRLMAFADKAKILKLGSVENLEITSMIVIS